MVTVNAPPTTDNFSILAQANLSISAERLFLFFIGLSLCSLLIASGLTVIGYWPVLVFAVAHLWVVGRLLWYAWRKQWVKEWIILDPDNVQVIHVDQHGRRLWQQDSRWARIEWADTGVPGVTPRRLILRSGAKRTEIGAFLNDAERQELADVLTQALAPISAWRG